MIHSSREITYIAFGAALISVCAWVSVPTDVPFTLQTFAVCLTAALLGLRDGLWSAAVYLLAGAVGAPVFAGFRGGLGVLLGVSGGYIVGFVFTALIVGLAADRYGLEGPALELSMGIGVLLCYGFGSAWFVVVYSAKSGSIGVLAVLMKCVVPYMIPDAVKILLAARLARRLHPVLHWRTTK